MGGHILVVEDDDSLREILEFNLGLFGYQVTTASNAVDAANLIAKQNYDLVLLDVMLPGGCGLQLCRQARTKNAEVNILMLTSLAEEQDKIQGLEMGADDYLTKPFSLRELQARIKARLRRNVQVAVNSVNFFELGGLQFDADRHLVSVHGNEVKLTVKEFELLAKLIKQPGQVFTRDQLLTDVWGYEFEGYEHTVNTHVNRLRKKLSPLDCIHTVWGVGYKFVISSEELVT